MGIGGVADNKNEVCWVLERRKGEKGMETHLGLYTAERFGKGWAIKLNDSRLLSWDLQVPQLSTLRPTVQQIMEQVKKAGKDP